MTHSLKCCTEYGECVSMEIFTKGLLVKLNSIVNIANYSMKFQVTFVLFLGSCILKNQACRASYCLNVDQLQERVMMNEAMDYK